MANFLIGAVIGAAAVVVLVLPLFGSWSTRLRFMLAAQAPDAFFAPQVWARLALREVVVVDVEVQAGLLAVALDERPAGTTPRRRVLLGDASAPSVVAMIEGWCAAAAPLLLILDENGDAHLYGPDGSSAGNLRDLPTELVG